MTDTRDEAVAKIAESLRELQRYGIQLMPKYRTACGESADLLATLSRQLAEAQAERERVIKERGQFAVIAAEAQMRLAEAQEAADKAIAESNAFSWAWGELSVDLRRDIAAEAPLQHRAILAHAAAMGTEK
jgi:hypothetical protein